MRNHWPLILVLAAFGCDAPKGSDAPSGEAAARAALEEAGEDVKALTLVRVDFPDTEAAAEAKELLLAAKRKAREELAQNGELRGTHPEVLAVVDAWLAREYPEEAIAVGGYSRLDRDLIAREPGSSVDLAEWPTLHPTLDEALGELAPSWFDNDIGALRPGRFENVPVILNVEYTVRPDGVANFSADSLSRGDILLTKIRADFVLYSKYPDGRTVVSQLPSKRLPESFRFTLAESTVGMSAQKNAMFLMAKSIAAGVRGHVSRSLGLSAPSGDAPAASSEGGGSRWPEHGRYRVTGTVKDDGCEGQVVFSEQVLEIDGDRRTLRLEGDGRVFLLARTAEGLVARMKLSDPNLCPKEYIEEAYVLRLSGADELVGVNESTYYLPPCEEPCTTTFDIAAKRVPASDEAEK